MIRHTTTFRRRVMVATAVALLAAVVTACLPAEPSSGRNAPIRRVLVLGDSVTYGLYGTTPRVHDWLGRRMADRGIALTIDGFPGETPVDTWPGNPPWTQRMRWWIAAQNPDMVVIQTTLFPNANDPGRRAAYRAAVRELFDIAQSRGAHVYVVAHNNPTNPTARNEKDVAQALQAEVARGRGISTIPLDWWLGQCDRPYVADGWHLSARGQECHANAVAVAVDQLRGVKG